MPKVGSYRVLYAESNEDCRRLMTTLLGFSEIAVESAGTVNDALHLAENKHFDLFLLGTRFPDDDGFELCRSLRATAPYTPIIFYSGDGRSVDSEKGLGAGADVYSVKPDSEEVISNVLQFAAQPQKCRCQIAPEISSVTKYNDTPPVPDIELPFIKRET